jgi:hypothetical protein
MPAFSLLEVAHVTLVLPSPKVFAHMVVGLTLGVVQYCCSLACTSALSQLRELKG